MNLKLQKLVNIPSPILIRGETGTGKSKLARDLFENSTIHKDRFLTVHLASLKEELLESELFGHRRGAFTGANESKNGYLKDVGAGTLFLDEIGELSLEAQKKLLYLLEEKKFTPVGSTQNQVFEGRIIMATNKALEKMVKAKTFREDLYYRIKVFQIELEPISADRNKLYLLITELFAQLKKSFNLPEAVLDEDLINHLISRQWKGNVRELKNTLEYALLMAETTVLNIRDLPAECRITSPEVDTSETFNEDYNTSLESFERVFFRTALDKYNGRINFTAQKLGISKTTLISKAKKYGINTLKLRAEVSELNSARAA